jgi:hypothetical protein
MKSITGGYGDGCCEHPFGNVFRHVSMNRTVHHLNGPFRAGNRLRWTSVSQALRPGLTEAARWAARARINPGSGSPPPTHYVDTIASRTIRIHLSWAILRSSSTLDLESLAHTSGPKGRFYQPRPQGRGHVVPIQFPGPERAVQNRIFRVNADYPCRPHIRPEGPVQPAQAERPGTRRAHTIPRP